MRLQWGKLRLEKTKLAWLTLAIGVLAFGSVAAIAQDPEPEIAATLQGTSVLPTNLLTTYSVYGASSSAVVAVSGSGLPFTEAFQLKTTAATPYFYSAGLGWTVTRDIPKNDLLVLTFWVKNTNPSLQVLRLVPILQDNKTYSNSLSTNAPTDQAAWVKYVIPFRANELYQVKGNGASMEFFFGVVPQSFEIGGIELLDYGQVANPIPASLLSTSAFYYPGRGNATAAWRVTAEKNIAATRMANLELTVTEKGLPVANAAVTVKQTASAFHWGSAIDGCNVAGVCLSAGNTKLYNANILKNFNSVVLENDLKWPEWECCHVNAVDGIAFAQKNHLALRGHNLIWPSFSYMPSDTATLTPAPLAKRINNHFEDEVGALKGDVYEWDVVNEPYDNYQVQGLVPGVAGVTPSPGVLGNPSIAGWYSLAHQIDSAPVLNLNDYSVFESKDPVHEAYDLALIKYIKSRGGTLGGFSFESHFGQSAPIFADMQATINDYQPYVTKFGVTEFDFTILDPALQADLTRDYMTFVFGQPKFNEFLMWGFWDGAHWLNSAPIYNLNWSLKPSGQVWQTLTQQTWQTHAKGSTSAKGTFSVSAFKGTYQVTATLNGKTCTVPLDLTSATALTIKLECN